MKGTFKACCRNLLEHLNWLRHNEGMILVNVGVRQEEFLKTLFQTFFPQFLLKNLVANLLSNSLKKVSWHY